MMLPPSTQQAPRPPPVGVTRERQWQAQQRGRKDEGHDARRIDLEGQVGLARERARLVAPAVVHRDAALGLLRGVGRIKGQCATVHGTSTRQPAPSPCLPRVRTCT